MASSSQHLGAYRNLTDKFMKVRDRARSSGRPFGYDSHARGQEAASTRLLEAAIGSSSSMGGGGGGGGEGAGLEGLSATPPPAWVDFSEEATADIQRIRQKMNELGSAHSKALLPNFDDMASDDHVVEVVTQEITRLFKRCESRLQKLGGPGAAAKDDERVVKNVQVKLATVGRCRLTLSNPR